MEVLQTPEFLKKEVDSDITIELPFIPPSVNDLYYTNKYGGRTLTDVGKIFKIRVKQFIAETYLEKLQNINPNGMFSIDMIFYLDPEEVFTKSYLDNPKTKSPYRIRDVGNMEKILIDTLKDAIMKDDCQIFRETLTKVASSRRRVEIKIREVNPEQFLDNLEHSEATNIVQKVNSYRKKENRNG